MKKFKDCLFIGMLFIIIGGALHASSQYKAPSWSLSSKLTNKLILINR